METFTNIICMIMVAFFTWIAWSLNWAILWISGAIFLGLVASSSLQSIRDEFKNCQKE